MPQSLSSTILRILVANARAGNKLIGLELEEVHRSAARIETRP
jgi:hypothetical protein